MVEGYFGEGNLPFVSASITFPALQTVVPTQQITLLVDTGCGVSMIGPKDTRDLGLLPHLEHVTPVQTVCLGVGGLVQGSSYLLDAVLVLKGTPKDLRLAYGEEPLGKLDVKPPCGHQGELEVPSLLGWDVFRYLLLAFDFPAGHCRLYTPEEAQSLQPIHD